MKTIAQMTGEVAEWAIDKGWRPDQRDVLQEMMLIVTEAAEAVEAWREKGMAETLKYTFPVGSFGTDNIYWQTDQAEPVITVGTTDPKQVGVATYARLVGVVPKPLGVASEAADILVRLLDFCGENGIDLEAEYEKKMAYNRTRSYRHGGKKA